MEKIEKLEFIYKKVRESGTKNSIEQFVYTVEEIGEIAEVLRILKGDVRKKYTEHVSLYKRLASEIGDTLITLYLITKFENLDFFDILEEAIDKEYNRWRLQKEPIDYLVKVTVNEDKIPDDKYFKSLLKKKE